MLEKEGMRVRKVEIGAVQLEQLIAATVREQAGEYVPGRPIHLPDEVGHGLVALWDRESPTVACESVSCIVDAFAGAAEGDVVTAIWRSAAVAGNSDEEADRLIETWKQLRDQL